MLVLLYYLSQNPSFAESVKPLMAQIKDSQQMLSFLNDLSKFSQTFSTFKFDAPPQKEAPSAEKPHHEPPKDEKIPQSPTEKIADSFIQNILDSYLKQHVKQ